MKEQKILHKLYEELVKLQKEIISSNLKLLVILEGRDAAGKDGTIKRITKHLSPRETKIVALGKPSDRQSLEWYFQRYVVHLPISGEFAIFNRSWYNRSGVEKVMGFCTDEEYKTFFTQVGLFEEMLANAGFIVLKYYLDISKKEQQARLLDRKKNPLKQWKISPIDDQAQHYWKEYSDARDKMLSKTNFKHSPWFIVKADDKSKTHIALITHLLSELQYQNKDKKLLSNDYGEVFPASGKNIADKLY
ncbi:polyphosphate kinase 2 [Ferruginibacter sp.]|uniref:polyphosphate kinase 2 n=1 Tax=Ferruginibacter sp. TaxID=1940288 RepID=UPI001989DB79|nr:polyphosphate kinase 2 [Ferruginibacter sp.]MBC7628374.1 polyphosphate kinase 2 [Ferruginibacter sp.]